MRQLCHLGKHLPNLQVSLTKYITVAVLGGEGEKNPSKDIIVNPTIGIGSYFGDTSVHLSIFLLFVDILFCKKMLNEKSSNGEYLKSTLFERLFVFVE